MTGNSTRMLQKEIYESNRTYHLSQNHIIFAIVLNFSLNKNKNENKVNPHYAIYSFIFQH